MPATHPHRIFAAPIGPATRNTIYTQQGPKPAYQQHIHTKFSQLLLAQLPRTQFTHSKAPNPHASNTSTQNFRSSYWHSYPEQHLHTARPQTRMPATHPHKIFAAPIGTATPNTIYTQQGSKPACQQYVHTKFSQLLLAQLPRTTFTHSTAPNPHASNTSTQNFRSSYWHSYPEQHLHTARPQARMPATHPHKIFAAPIGTAIPNTIYTQQGSKPACQQHIHTKFSQLLLAQLPRTTFTHSKAPNPHASRTSTQNFHSSYWHSYPDHNLHTARPQTRTPTTHPHKIFSAPFATATPCRCSKSHACHAKAAAERRSPKRAKAYIRPRASAPSPTPAAQKQRQSGGAQNAPKRTSDPAQVLQVPRLPRKSSGRAAEPKTRQSVHQTPRKRSKSHACHAKAAADSGAQNAPKRTSDPVQALQVPRLPRKSSGRAADPKTRQSVHHTPCKCSKSHACHAKAAEERRSPKRAKAYIRPRASAPSPTPATQKQRQSGGAQNAPKRTSDPVQVLHLHKPVCYN